MSQAYRDAILAAAIAIAYRPNDDEFVISDYESPKDTPKPKPKPKHKHDPEIAARYRAERAERKRMAHARRYPK